MANFETWKFDSLVKFARDAQAKIEELEATLAECDKDRKDLLVELRKMILKEAGRDPGS